MTVLLMKLNVQWSFIAVHVVEKITLLGTAGKTVVIEMKRNKRHKRSECVETTKKPAKALQRKRKAEAEEDKLVKTKIRKAETFARNERQEKEMKEFNAGMMVP